MNQTLTSNTLCLTLKRFPCSWSLSKQGYLDLAFKVYVSLFCLLFMLVECNTPEKQIFFKPTGPGAFYTHFRGLICLEEAYLGRVQEMLSLHADEFQLLGHPGSCKDHFG